MTGDDYDLMLHCTLGHMRRVDDALPDFEDGAKALNFFAPKGEHRFIFCIFCIFSFGVCYGQAYFERVTACLWTLVLMHAL